jgi:hypothetical protein
MEDQKKHREHHIELHHAIDELVADFLWHNRKKHLGDTTVLELLQWSFDQTQKPTPTQKPDAS